MKSLKQRILDAWKTKDEKEIEKIVDEMPEGEGLNGTQIHIHAGGAPAEKASTEDAEDPYEKRFKAIEDGIKSMTDAFAAFGKTKDEETAEAARKKAEDEAREKAEDDDAEEMSQEVDDAEREEAIKAKDSAYLLKPFESVKSKADIIAPGVKLPTFDKAAQPKATFKDCICGLRRKALQLGANDAATSKIIDQVRGRATDSAEFMTMSAKDVRTIFNSVAALKAAQNNGAVTRDSGVGAVQHESEVNPMKAFKDASNKRWGIGQSK